jgi:hypothetical protein
MEEVDIPVMIPHPDRTYLDIKMPKLIFATEPGCKGWNEVMERLLSEYEKTKEI